MPIIWNTSPLECIDPSLPSTLRQGSYFEKGIGRFNGFVGLLPIKPN